MFNRQLTRRFYTATLSATAFFMPLSVWILTLFIIVLVIGWLADGGLMRIPELKKPRLEVLISLGAYFVCLFWMLNTSDLSFGLRELKLKLPLLIFPVVFGLSGPLDKKELKTVLSFFIAGVVLSSIIGLISYYTDKNIYDIANTRKISLFVSHVRLALMTNLSIIISAWYFFSDSSKNTRLIYLAASIWLTVFLFLLLSVTGIIIFAALLLISIFLIIKKSGSVFFKTISVIFIVTLFISAVLYISKEIKAFYKPGNAYSFPLIERTVNGNAYLHYPERKDIENGNHVWIYLCEGELSREWNLRSNIKYDSNDIRDQKLRFTLIRYLSSAGLTKDSAGLSVLMESDIKYIENGFTNKLFTEGKQIRSRIYEIIWQIDYYNNGGNPSGHSITQRIEYLKKGWHLFRENAFTGTGTGDVRSEFTGQFSKESSRLDAKYIYLPHNQYLTFLISFGISGFLIICFSILIPVLRMKAFSSFLFNIFFIIILLSMLGEDTMETHTGVSFFAYFYSLFVFGEGKR
ncbi:MAG: hypothetical protein C0408_01965 [Odoribacter sp.]|nr:hypothetical protein [Odoribacter sp.]